jgi:hypothetical protein
MDFNAYFQTKSLVKTPKQGVHYEQKTTPDLIWCVSSAVYDLVKDDPDKVLSDADVRSSQTFCTLMQEFFSKPAPTDDKTRNEYNKVSSYQLGVLAYAGILEQLTTRPKTYKVANFEAIQFMASNDFNASRFLLEYTDKFIADNGLQEVFFNYQQNPNQANYLLAKEAYWNWAVINTAVKGTDRKHSYRVFNKMFNVFCYKHKIPGQDASNIITGPCPYSFLIYNRDNFRDKDMPSGMTRQQYFEEVLSLIDTGGVVETLLQKVKEAIKKRHGNDSEIKSSEFGYAENSGVHVHHILPRHSYPEFSLTKENLIALTPGQHLSHAHIEANTRSINPEFQIVCIKQKFLQLKSSIKSDDKFYSLTNFIEVVNTCFDAGLSKDSTVGDVEQFLATI